MDASRLGPVLYASIATADPAALIDAYAQHLETHCSNRYSLSGAQAECWGRPVLQSSPVAWLENSLHEPWLQVIGIDGLEKVDPFHHSGWFSLEVCVQDTDALHEDLQNSPFSIIGPPANLDVSDAIRAMQAIGPAGEVLYLTEIKAEVPPFELPFARCNVDRLFIPVMLTPDRERSARQYGALAGREHLQFDTKITVINRARGQPETTRHPVATLQLDGHHLIEMDQIEHLSERPETMGLPAGIAWIAFAIKQLPAGSPVYTIEQGPYAGHAALMLRGTAGELYELIETTS